MRILLFCFLYVLNNKIWASDTPPFKYLNQYYTYEYVNSSSFKINETLYSFDNFSFTIAESDIKISIKDTSSFKTKNITIEVLDLKDKIVQTFVVAPIDNQLNKNLDINPKIINSVCFSAKNEFTTKKICKKFHETTQQIKGDLLFSANGISLSATGQILLNDKKERLNFRAENSHYFFELTTGYKNVIPNRAYKMKQSSIIQVDFAELSQPNKYNFKKQINLSDTSFEIEIDELISVHQDIFFINDDLINASVEYEFKNWVVRKYNKLGLEPVILFSQLATESVALNAKFISNLSLGTNVYFTHYLDNNFEYYYLGKLMLLRLSNDVNNNVINNNTLSLITLSGGARYYTSPAFYYDLNLSLQDIVYAEYQPSTLSVDIVKGITPTITFSANSILIEVSKFRFHASGGFGLIAPTSIPSGQTQTAFNVVLGSQFSYKLRGGRIYYGLDYSTYNTRNTTYKYSRQSLEHKFGFYYLY